MARFLQRSHWAIWLKRGRMLTVGLSAPMAWMGRGEGLYFVNVVRVGRYGQFLIPFGDRVYQMTIYLWTVR